LQLEALEDRLDPATFSGAGATLDLVLGAGEQVTVVSNGATYTLSLTGGTWSGTNSAFEAGNGTATLTVTAAGISTYTTGIDITDTGAGGDAVTFGDSGESTYVTNFAVSLLQSSALTFSGRSTFIGTDLTAAVNGNIVVNTGGGIDMGGGALSLSANGANTSLTLGSSVDDTTGDLTFRATGAVTEAGGVTVNTGGSVELSADVTSAGAGDDGVGTVTVNGNVYGASITLRGADADIAPTANVGRAVAVAQTMSVTIRSSVGSRPMEIGGTNNSAAAGINLTSAELARIVTSSGGTITFGDTNQTGNITFAGATTATTAGAFTNVIQSTSGAGQIVFDNSSGTALNGNGGTVTLTPGTGELSATLTTTSPLIASNGFVTAGLTLDLALDLDPSSAAALTLVADTGAAITGAFTNLSPGGTTTLSYIGIPCPFAISYAGGTGHDLTITDTLPIVHLPPLLPPIALLPPTLPPVTLSLSASPPPASPPASPPPPSGPVAVRVTSVSVAFGPQGEVVEAVDSSGVLTQYDATGAHPLIGGVASVSVAFGPQGEVFEVVSTSGVLTQYDSAGARVIAGGVRSANVAFGPQGEVLEVVNTSGVLTQYDSTGAHALIGGVVSASVTFGPQGAVYEVIDASGTLTQYDATGAHPLFGGLRSAAVAFGPQGKVLVVTTATGEVIRYDSTGTDVLVAGSAG